MDLEHMNIYVQEQLLALAEEAKIMDKNDAELSLKISERYLELMKNIKIYSIPDIDIEKNGDSNSFYFSGLLKQVSDNYNDNPK